MNRYKLPTAEFNDKACIELKLNLYYWNDQYNHNDILMPYLYNYMCFYIGLKSHI